MDDESFQINVSNKDSSWFGYGIVKRVRLNINEFRKSSDKDEYRLSI